MVQWKRTCFAFQASHIRGVGNQPVDWVATEAIKGDFLIETDTDISHSLGLLLCADSISARFPRLYCHEATELCAKKKKEMRL